MAAGTDHLAPEAEVDLVPIGEGLRDRRVGLGVAVQEGAERLVRKDHPEAEGVVGPVALVEVDLRLGHGLLDQDREVEPARSAADHRNAHSNKVLANDTQLDYM